MKRTFVIGTHGCRSITIPALVYFINTFDSIVYSFIKNVPNIQDCWHVPAPSTVLTIKGVYVINYSLYGQIIDHVCKSYLGVIWCAEFL